MDPHSQSQAHCYDSSLEELSLEAKLLLASTKRQDPQGEEHTNLPSPSCSGHANSKNPKSQAHSQFSSNPSNRQNVVSKPTKYLNQKGQIQKGHGHGGAGGSNSGSPRESSTTSTSSGSGSSYSEDEEPTAPAPATTSDRNRNPGAPSQSKAHHYASGSGTTATGPGPKPKVSTPAKIKGLSSNISTDSSGNSAYNTLIIHQNNSSLLADTWIPATHEFTSMSMSMGNSNNTNNNHSHSNSMGVLPINYSHQHQAYSNRPIAPSTALHSHQYEPAYSNPYENISGGTGSSEISEIPRDYLNQLTVLKHLAKEVHQDPVSGTTGSGSSLLRSASFSKSQPDLTQGQGLAQAGGSGPGLGGTQLSPSNYNKPQPQEPSSSSSRKGRSNQNQSNLIPQSQPQPTDHLLQIPSVQILELLMRENAVLNAELVKARIKIQTIHKLESELDRLQATHSELFQSAERRESLERTARAKLSTELNRVKKVNRELLSSSGSIQNLSSSSSGGICPAEIESLRKELGNKDSLISQLLSQNKELQSIKERQEIELTAQRATLAEQRTHIDILDSALTNAQASVLRLEEQVCKKQEIIDKSSHLQRAFSSLQITNDKREENERLARAQLEDEITDLKLRLASSTNNPSSPLGILDRDRPRCYQSPPPYGAHPHPHAQSQSPSASRFELNSPNPESQMNYLQEKLKVSEEQIQHLNSQVKRWENVFDYQQIQSHNSNQQQHRKQSTTSTTPNTPNSWAGSGNNFGAGAGARSGTPGIDLQGEKQQHFFPSSEKLCSSADSANYHQATKSNELEWKIKDLETRLVERDAMIRALRGGPNYRDSPSYSQASTASCYGGGLGQGRHHQASGSGSALYSQTLSDELPNYANIRAVRLGGSGSSLVANSKNSNESLQLCHQGTTSGTGSSGSLASERNGTTGSGAGGGNNSSSSRTIEEQLKDLDSQLLTKAGIPVGTLKIQSGLCCIPGLTNPTSSKGKGNMASLNAMAGGPGYGSTSRKLLASSSSYLPPKPIPKPPPSTYQTQNHFSSSGAGAGAGRAGSGPPFITSAGGANSQQQSVIAPLSNSVDSVLSDSTANKDSSNNHQKKEPIDIQEKLSHVFTPAALPKGLPPRPDSTGGPSTRSLERNKPLPNELVGKYTVITNRCRSLDRRELKKAAAAAAEEKVQETVVLKKPEKELSSKGNLKSKAAFFGQLLSRRSPSPSRTSSNNEKSEKEQSSTPKSSRRFPFGSKSSSTAETKTPLPPPQNDAEVETSILEKQGRQSQRNRISSKWTSTQALEVVEEAQSGTESSASPWVQRKTYDEKDNTNTESQNQNQNEPGISSFSPASSENKKWGRIVKTPFGLRYTFGSPRVASNVTHDK